MQQRNHSMLQNKPLKKGTLVADFYILFKYANGEDKALA